MLSKLMLLCKLSNHIIYSPSCFTCYKCFVGCDESDKSDTQFIIGLHNMLKDNKIIMWIFCRYYNCDKLHD